MGRKQSVTFKSSKISKLFLALASTSQNALAAKPDHDPNRHLAGQSSKENESLNSQKISGLDQFNMLNFLEFADSSNQLDTISFSNNLLNSLDKTIDHLEKSVNIKLFSKPCCVSKRALLCEEECFGWETPIIQNTDLGISVLTIFERFIWLSYAAHFSGIEKQACPIFKEIDALSAFWKSISGKQKSELILAIQKDTTNLTNHIMPVLHILKDSIEKPDFDVISKLTFIGFKDLGTLHKGARFVLDFLKNVTIPNCIVINPALSQNKRCELSAFDDDPLNTSISTQISGKSKCNSRRGSADDSLVGMVTFWMYGEDDYELIAIKSTGKMLGNVLNNLGTEEIPITVESDIDFLSELENELEKTKVLPSELLEPSLREQDIISVFWSKPKKNKSQTLALLEKEEAKTNAHKKSQAKIAPDSKTKFTAEKEVKKQMKVEYKEAVQTQILENKDDSFNITKPWKMTAKDKYDYLKMPTKTWPLRPTTENSFSTQNTDFSVPGLAEPSNNRAEFQEDEIVKNLINLQPSQSVNNQQNDVVTQNIENVLLKLENFHKTLEPFRTKLLEVLAKAIKKSLEPNQVEVEMYGSMRNGLAIENSDIDLRITGLDLCGQDEIREMILKLEKKIKSERYIKSLTSITTAKVPVLKLVF